MQARDELSASLAESLVTAVCLPFVMPPKMAQEMKRICLKLPPAANELLAKTARRTKCSTGKCTLATSKQYGHGEHGQGEHVVSVAMVSIWYGEHLVWLAWPRYAEYGRRTALLSQPAVT